MKSDCSFFFPLVLCTMVTLITNMFLIVLFSGEIARKLDKIDEEYSALIDTIKPVDLTQEVQNNE